MRTILLSLALGALLFGVLVGAVRPRVEAPPTPVAAPAPAPATVMIEVPVEEDPEVEAAVLSRIDLRAWGVAGGRPKYHAFSRAMPPARKPAPRRID